MAYIQVRISDKFKKQFVDKCKKWEISISHIIKMLLREWLNKNDKQG